VILLSLIHFIVLNLIGKSNWESLGSFFLGVGYLLLGLSRKHEDASDRKRSLSNLAYVALILGTVFVAFYTFYILDSLK
jgi:hypothetical protein